MPDAPGAPADSDDPASFSSVLAARLQRYSGGIAVRAAGERPPGVIERPETAGGLDPGLTGSLQSLLSYRQTVIAEPPPGPGGDPRFLPGAAGHPGGRPAEAADTETATAGAGPPSDSAVGDGESDDGDGPPAWFRTLSANFARATAAIQRTPEMPPGITLPPPTAAPPGRGRRRSRVEEIGAQSPSPPPAVSRDASGDGPAVGPSPAPGPEATRPETPTPAGSGRATPTPGPDATPDVPRMAAPILQRKSPRRGQPAPPATPAPAPSQPVAPAGSTPALATPPTVPSVPASPRRVVAAVPPLPPGETGAPPSPTVLQRSPAGRAAAVASARVDVGETLTAAPGLPAPAREGRPPGEPAARAEPQPRTPPAGEGSKNPAIQAGNRGKPLPAPAAEGFRGTNPDAGPETADIARMVESTTRSTAAAGGASQPGPTASGAASPRQPLDIEPPAASAGGAVSPASPSSREREEPALSPGVEPSRLPPAPAESRASTPGPAGPPGYRRRSLPPCPHEGIRRSRALPEGPRPRPVPRRPGSLHADLPRHNPHAPRMRRSGYPSPARPPDPQSSALRTSRHPWPCHGPTRLLARRQQAPIPRRTRCRGPGPRPIPRVRPVSRHKLQPDQTPRRRPTSRARQPRLRKLPDRSPGASLLLPYQPRLPASTGRRPLCPLQRPAQPWTTSPLPRAKPGSLGGRLPPARPRLARRCRASLPRPTRMPSVSHRPQRPHPGRHWSAGRRTSHLPRPPGPLPSLPRRPNSGRETTPGRPHAGHWKLPRYPVEGRTSADDPSGGTRPHTPRPRLSRRVTRRALRPPHPASWTAPSRRPPLRAVPRPGRRTARRGASGPRSTRRPSPPVQRPWRPRAPRTSSGPAASPIVPEAPSQQPTPSASRPFAPAAPEAAPSGLPGARPVEGAPQGTPPSLPTTAPPAGDATVPPATGRARAVHSPGPDDARPLPPSGHQAPAASERASASASPSLPGPQSPRAAPQSAAGPHTPAPAASPGDSGPAPTGGMPDVVARLDPAECRRDAVRDARPRPGSA